MSVWTSPDISWVFGHYLIFCEWTLPDISVWHYLIYNKCLDTIWYTMSVWTLPDIPWVFGHYLGCLDTSWYTMSVWTLPDIWYTTSIWTLLTYHECLYTTWYIMSVYTLPDILWVFDTPWYTKSVWTLSDIPWVDTTWYIIFEIFQNVVCWKFYPAKCYNKMPSKKAPFPVMTKGEQKNHDEEDHRQVRSGINHLERI